MPCCSLKARAHARVPRGVRAVPSPSNILNSSTVILFWGRTRNPNRPSYKKTKLTSHNLWKHNKKVHKSNSPQYENKNVVVFQPQPLQSHFLGFVSNSVTVNPTKKSPKPLEGNGGHYRAFQSFHQTHKSLTSQADIHIQNLFFVGFFMSQKVEGNTKMALKKANDHWSFLVLFSFFSSLKLY